jgi:hypothetical protein
MVAGSGTAIGIPAKAGTAEPTRIKADAKIRFIATSYKSTSEFQQLSGRIRKINKHKYLGIYEARNCNLNLHRSPVVAGRETAAVRDRAAMICRISRHGPMPAGLTAKILAPAMTVSAGTGSMPKAVDSP